MKTLPIEETQKRLEQREKEVENNIHPMNRSNIGERISKDWEKWITVDNYCWEFYMEEFDTKQEAIKRLEELE